MINKKISKKKIIKNLYNWLFNNNYYNLNCLDLFSGEGFLSLNIFPKICNNLILIEKNKHIFHNLKLNYEKYVYFNLYLNIKIINYNSLKYILNKNIIKCDLILLDPMYRDIKSLFFVINYILKLKKNFLIFLETIINPYLFIFYSFKKLILLKTVLFNNINLIFLKRI